MHPFILIIQALRESREPREVGLRVRRGLDLMLAVQEIRYSGKEARTLADYIGRNAFRLPDVQHGIIAIAEAVALVSQFVSVEHSLQVDPLQTSQP